ncbi:MAG: TraR/DksA C4-type zinc finger protein [Fuerstiella sp.]
MLTTDELDQFRQMLLAIQARVRGDVEQIEAEAFSGKESDHGSSNHMAEMGTDAWDLDFSLRMVENDEEFLKDISTALAKIRNGTFGLCEMCLENGVPPAKAKIPKARLRAIPHARNCVACERKRESEN